MRRSSAVLAAIAVLCVSSMAYAKTMTPGEGVKGSWFIGPIGAVSQPLGDLSDKDKGNFGTGFDVGGLVDYMLTDQIGLGVDGAFNSSSNKDVSAFKAKTTNFGAHGEWFIPTGGKVMPYLGAGVGFYNRKLEFSSGGSNINVTNGSVGVNGGVGLGIPLAPNIGIGVDARYHWTPSTDFDNNFSEKVNWSYATFNAAILNRVPMGGGISGMK